VDAAEIPSSSVVSSRSDNHQFPSNPSIRVGTDFFMKAIRQVLEKIIHLSWRQAPRSVNLISDVTFQFYYYDYLTQHTTYNHLQSFTNYLVYLVIE
jgi:hypothetical protein